MLSSQNPDRPIETALLLTCSTTTFTSRRTSLNSMQSSNPDLCRIDESYFSNQNEEKTRNRNLSDKLQNEQNYQGLQSFGVDDEPHEDYDTSGDGIGVINEDTSALFHSLKSPLSGIGTLLSTMESELDFLNDLPNSLIRYAFMKISSELAKTPGIDAETLGYSEFTRSSQLSPNQFTNTKFEDLSPTSKKEFTRKNLIEELIDTEEGYVSTLKMLSGIYLGSIISKGNNGIPIRQLLQYVDLLIATHESFLNDLRKLYLVSHRASEESNNFIVTFPNSFYTSTYEMMAKSLIAPTSPFMAALVAELISKKLISLYIYQEYSSIHDLVLKLINSKEDDPEFGRTLTRGYQHFLEASQDTNEKLDLSLGSLIQRPIGRLGRYKLFLDSLEKLTTIEEDEECHQKILTSACQVDYTIKEVNRYGLQEKIRASSLYDNLNFDNCAKLNFPVEYLGMPLLLGSLYVSWLSNKENHVTTEILGAFLFKTHLILAKVIKSTNFEVKFLIPLSVSQLVESFDFSGGLFTDYEYCFKLRFEFDFAIVELLLTQVEALEYSVWKDKFDVLINHVNGPYPLDYSSSKFNEEQGTNSSTIIPTLGIQFYDAKVDKFKNVLSIRSRTYHHHYRTRDRNMDVLNRCYFAVVIPVKVEKSTGTENYSSLRFKSFKLQSGSIEKKSIQTVYLKDLEWVKMGWYLEDLWSEELIKFTSLDSKRSKSRQRRNTNKKTSLKKSKIKDTQSERVSKDGSTGDSNRAREESLLADQLGSLRKKSKSSSRVSLIRRTSTVFGDALKSLLNGPNY